MKKIHLSSELSLPLQVVTESVGILAKRRVGKSFTARKIAEQIFQAGQQICVIDPKGDWWGMRYARDGKSPGLGIFIFGGEHGDIPLEVNSGELVAGLLVRDHVSILLDLSMFRKREIAIFMEAFLENLYRLKAQEQFRSALMLVVDEADAIAPQKPQDNEARMLGAIEDIVRRGGQRGIGSLMITQRSAVLNKNVLTQIQVLITLRTISPQDLKAMNEWIDVHGNREQRQVLMESLPSLPVGDCWVWSPGWPTDEGIFQRIHVDNIETFDSGASPKPGEVRVKPKNIAKVDLESIRSQMSEVMEQAKANDPKVLKARIKELEQEVKKKEKPMAPPAEVKQMLAIPNEQIDKLDKFYTGLIMAADDVSTVLRKKSDEWALLRSDAAKVLEAVRLVRAQKGYVMVHRGKETAFQPKKSDYRTYPQKTKTGNHKLVPGTSSPPLIWNTPSNGSLPRCERAILTALAQMGKPTSKSKAAILSGYSANSGGFNNSLGKLRSSGFIDGRGDMSITSEGLKELGQFEVLPTGGDLHQHWLRELPKCESSILRVLIAEHPGSLTKAEIGVATGYSDNSGGFNNSLGRLRTLQLISGYGDIKASDDLFE